MNKKKVIVLTGAGISAESGISTFRDANGLWEGHDWREVASPAGWSKNPELVLRFYNDRRENVREAQPNPGHHGLVELEKAFNVQIITQNVDDLHERAGSTQILHLHGEIRKARSTGNPSLVYDLGDKDIQDGDTCEEGHQLRPHIVWFGEDVPFFGPAVQLSMTADILLIVGTSMAVYPANTLVEYVPEHCRIFLIDPNKPDYEFSRDVFFIQENGSTGVPKVVKKLLKEIEE